MIVAMRATAATLHLALGLLAPWLALAQEGGDRKTPADLIASWRASAAPLFDAGRLKEGRFIYRRTVRGAPMGSFALTIRRQADGDYAFTGEAMGFKQHWESVATAQFQPKRALLKLMQGEQPYRMELAYEPCLMVAISMKDRTETVKQAARVHATVMKGDLLAAKPDITETTTELPCGPTVDQRIDWAAVMASGLAPGQSATFWVYDAGTGASRVIVSASETSAMHSPVGMHTMIRLEYRIGKAGKAPESYVVFATRDAPRMMLREELREDEVSELESIEP